MQRLFNKNLISILLITCLTVTTLFIPSIFHNTTYAAVTSTQASLSKSIIKNPSTMIAGKSFTVTFTGDRQSEVGTINGETRFIPYSYVITHSNGTIKSPLGLKANSSGNYSYKIRFTDPGKKTIGVTWLYQKFNNKVWKTVSKENTKKIIDIKGTLKFSANGGAVKTKSKYVTQNSKVGMMPKPTKRGYTFKGWFTKKSGGSKLSSSTRIKFTGQTKTIYARWAPIKGSYAVSLNANGGKSSLKSIKVIKGKKYNNLQSLPNPTRTNYNFIGWYTAKTGGSKISNASTVSKTYKHTLYARWKNIYTVSFDPNGGKIAISSSSKTVTLGSKYGTLPVPTKANYVFAGWYTTRSGGTKVSASTVVNLKNNQILYAKWAENGSIISSYDSAAKSIIARIGKQAASQCAVYSMSYCTAIKNKKFVAPSSYLIGDLAYWSLGGMNRLDFSSASASTSQKNAMATIKNQIDNNLPCIIRTTYGTSGQHWVVVVGYVPDATTYSDLYILDPAASDVTQVFLFFNTKYYFPKDGYIGVATY